jgi:uridine kinase
VVETLKRLKEGKNVEVPIYNFTTHSREKLKKTIYGANVVIFEGIMAFCNAEAREVRFYPTPSKYCLSIFFFFRLWI